MVKLSEQYEIREAEVPRAITNPYGLLMRTDEGMVALADQVWVLFLEREYINGGSSYQGVFSSPAQAERYIRKVHPGAIVTTEQETALTYRVTVELMLGNLAYTCDLETIDGEVSDAPPINPSRSGADSEADGDHPTSLDRPGN